MGNAKSSESMPGEASNVVPMRSKLKADKGTVKRLCMMLNVKRMYAHGHLTPIAPCTELNIEADSAACSQKVSTR